MRTSALHYSHQFHEAVHRNLKDLEPIFMLAWKFTFLGVEFPVAEVEEDSCGIFFTFVCCPLVLIYQEELKSVSVSYTSVSTICLDSTRYVMKCHAFLFLAAQAWSTLKSLRKLLMSKTCKHISEQEGKAGVSHYSGVDFCHCNPVPKEHLPWTGCQWRTSGFQHRSVQRTNSFSPKMKSLKSVCPAQRAYSIKKLQKPVPQKTTQNSLGRWCFYIIRAGIFMWVAFSDFFFKKKTLFTCWR